MISVVNFSLSLLFFFCFVVVCIFLVIRVIVKLIVIFVDIEIDFFEGEVWKELVRLRVDVDFVVCVFNGNNVYFEDDIFLVVIIGVGINGIFVEIVEVFDVVGIIIEDDVLE